MGYTVESLARSPAVHRAIASARRRGLPLDTLEQRAPGLVAAADAVLTERLSRMPEVARQRARVMFGLGDKPSAPVVSVSVVASDGAALPSGDPPPDLHPPEGSPSVSVAAPQTDDDRRRIVAEAPTEGLTAWLAERGIARATFYRWRERYGSAQPQE